MQLHRFPRHARRGSVRVRASPRAATARDCTHSMHYRADGRATTQTRPRRKCMISAIWAGRWRWSRCCRGWRLGKRFYRRKRFLRDDKTPPHRLEPFWLPPSGSLTVLHARSRFPHHLARFLAARRAQVWAPHRHQHLLWDYLRARQVAQDRWNREIDRRLGGSTRAG